MELVTTPITKIEIDLHRTINYIPDYQQDIRYLQEQDDLSSQDQKLYRLLVTSFSNFLLYDWNKSES